jgi:DHA1 family bicyclomycin/chloramphenicol resistance-like MFS transporter
MPAPRFSAARSAAPRSPAVAALVLMLIVLPIMAMDLQFAAMPGMARDLGASVASVQLTLSAFAISFGVMQLIHGPLSDRVGRKPLIVGGMALFALASLACALAPSAEALTAARIVQAVGASAGPVLGRAVIRDVHGGPGAARVLGYVMAAFGIVAIFGPFLGAMLVEGIGWRAPFHAMAGFGGIAAALCAWLLPETRPDRADNSRRIGALLGDFRALLGSRRVMLFAVTGGLMQGAFFAWLAGASFVIVRAYGYSAGTVGLVLPVTVFGFVLSSFLTGRFAGRVPYAYMVAMGVCIGAAGGLAGLALAVLGEPGLWLLLVPITIVALGHGATLSQAAAGAMAPFPERAGAASALSGFMQYLGVTASVGLNGLLFDGTAKPMMAIIAGFAVAAALLYLPFARSR